MKYFSLIKEETVHPATDKKIIPAEEFSKLVNAEEILQTVKDQSVAYRAEVTQECEKLKEESIKKGFEEGLKQWNEQISFLENEKNKVRKEMENSIVPLALAAIKKLIGRELETKPETIADIVSTALKGVSHHRKIAIFVNRNDLEYIEKQKQRIKDVFEHLDSLTIAARDDVEDKKAVIETEAGIIKVDLDLQLQALEAAMMQTQVKGG